MVRKGGEGGLFTSLKIKFLNLRQRKFNDSDLTCSIKYIECYCVNLQRTTSLIKTYRTIWIGLWRVGYNPQIIDYKDIKVIVVAFTLTKRYCLFLLLLPYGMRTGIE